MKNILIICVIFALGYIGWSMFGTYTKQIQPAPLETQTIETDYTGIYTELPKNAVKDFPEIHTYTSDLMAQFEKDYGELSEKEIQTLGLGQDKIYELRINTRIATSTKTISYIISAYEYTGGAHGMTTVKAFTYDAQGKYINESKVFVDTTWKEKISSMLTDALVAKLKDATTKEQIQDGTAPNKDNLNEWYITDDAIVFIFGQYTIGPYVLGIQEVPLLKENLKGIIKPGI